MSPDKVQCLSQEVPGWLLPGEGRLLYRLARQCRGQGVIVEIGSWKGKSTIWLGKGSEAGPQTKVYAVDPHIGSEEHQSSSASVWTFDQFKENIRKADLNHLVVPLVKTSADAARDFSEPVELIFIDGAHDYASVKQDLELWWPKVITGGRIAFHDTIGWPGPRRLVAEQVFRSRHFRHVQFVHSISYGQKVASNSLWDCFRNRGFLYLKNGYEILFRVAMWKPVHDLILLILGRSRTPNP